MIPVIQELDGALPEPRPTWRQRWLRPIAAAALLGAVLLGAFVHPAPPRAAVPAAGAVPLQSAPKVRALPPTVARLLNRTPFSGVTGLTPAGQSEGFRDLYRLPDGRTVSVTEIPESTAGPLRVPQGALSWVAGGMRYLLVGADVSPEELAGLADHLR